MKQFFILGRNPELSREELFSYLDARDMKYKEILFEENYLVLELDFEFDIQELGGTIKQGKIEFEDTIFGFAEFLGKNDLVQEDKFTYSLFGNAEIDLLKNYFKENRQKAILKHGGKNLHLQEGPEVKFPNADHLFFAYETEKTFYFGKILQEYNYNEVKKRDLGRPYSREELDISARLSKILINLSGTKKDDLLLDPFCGIGGIMQEALIKKINVYGSDKDFMAIQNCQKNMQWLKRNYKIDNFYMVYRKDANKVPSKNYDAVATESPLGEVVRKKPSDQKAKQIIKDFENLIIPILKHLKEVKKSKARIAITFPKIREFSANYDKIQKATGLKLVKGPILEARKRHFIARDIIVFN